MRINYIICELNAWEKQQWIPCEPTHKGKKWEWRAEMHTCLTSRRWVGGRFYTSSQHLHFQHDCLWTAKTFHFLVTFYNTINKEIKEKWQVFLEYHSKTGPGICRPFWESLWNSDKIIKNVLNWDDGTMLLLKYDQICWNS